MKDTILVIDLGSRENERLLRELASLGVEGKLCPWNITLEEIRAMPGVKGIILNGGPDRLENGMEKDVSMEIYQCELPALLVDHRGDAPWPRDEMERRNVLRGFVLGFCGVEEK